MSSTATDLAAEAVYFSHRRAEDGTCQAGCDDWPCGQLFEAVEALTHAAHPELFENPGPVPARSRSR